MDGPAIQRCTIRHFSWIGGLIYPTGPDAIPSTAIYGTPFPQIALIVGSDYAIEVFWKKGQRACVWAQSFTDKPIHLTVEFDNARIQRR